MVGVVSQHRFDRSSKRVLDAIARGGLGRLTSARASCAWWRGQSYYDSSEWCGTWLGDGGEATMNQAIHIIDLMVAAMGEPVKVFACTATLAHERIEVEDTAVAVVRFASGALGTIHATTAAYPGLGLLLAIHGDGGSAAIIDEELSFLHATDGAAPPIEMSDSGIPTTRSVQKTSLTPWSEPSAWRTPSSYGTSSSPYGLAVTVIQTPARASARPTGAGSSPSSSACTSPHAPTGPYGSRDRTSDYAGSSPIVRPSTPIAPWVCRWRGSGRRLLGFSEVVDGLAAQSA